MLLDSYLILSYEDRSQQAESNSLRPEVLRELEIPPEP